MEILFTLFLLLLLNAFTVIGAYIAANHQDSKGRKLILNPLHKFLTKILGTWYNKPFFGCYKCMASIWGITGYIWFVLESPHMPVDRLTTWIGVLPYVLTLSGLTSFLYSLYEYHLDYSDPNRCKYDQCTTQSDKNFTCEGEKKDSLEDIACSVLLPADEDFIKRIKGIKKKQVNQSPDGVFLSSKWEQTKKAYYTTLNENLQFVILNGGEIIIYINGNSIIKSKPLPQHQFFQLIEDYMGKKLEVS